MLKDEVLRLRHVLASDLDRLLPLLNDLQIRGEYLPTALTSPEKWRKQFAEHQFCTEDYERWLIVDAQDQLLGTIWHFKSVPYFNAREIGYLLFDLGARNQGIASRALRLLTAHLFASTHLNRLEIRMSTDNLASEKVAVKNGFCKEGVSRAANFVRGRHVDMNVYALLREEWQASRRD